MSGNGVGLRQKSIVVISGELPGGGEIVQNLALDHDTGVPEGNLIGQAFAYARQAGGLMIDAPGGSVYFYPLIHFTRVHFEVKRVVLQEVGLQ